MNLLEEEEEFSQNSSEDNFTDEELAQQPPKKRKTKSDTDGKLKKIKYEDITSKPEKPKNELYKPPTVEELNELKETQNLYNNNLFRLQIEELIKEVKIKNKHRNAFKDWYQSFESFLNELPEYNVQLSEIKLKKKKKLSEIDNFISGIANEALKSDQDFTLKFTKPEKSEIFGLDAINALPGPKLRVNINLTMPRECFNVKDYLNNRYLVKRYYFLAYIFYHLKEKKLSGDIDWTWQHTKLLPVLRIKLHEKITIKIFATPTDNYFKLSRFLPDINNVKVDVFNVGAITEAPTIYYNASLAHDATLTLNNSFIRETLTELTNAQEAVKLIYVWLVQRGLNEGLGAFTDELILYFIVYLFTKKKINKYMSSYQIVRNFWNFISDSDLSKTPLSLSDDTKPEVLDSFKENYDVVLLDRSGCYNVASFLNLQVYKKIKSECEIAFKLLDGGINSFHSLFITKLTLELQYDLILNVKVAKIGEKMTDDERTKFLGHPELFVIKYIQGVLEKGLNKRATLIVPIVTTQSQVDKITFGINLDQSNAFHILEKGPALNDPQEREFKEFWGDLATDRRFKDGSVCVAVYFETQTIKQRREIIKTIVDWVICKKLGLEYSLHYDEFEELLVNKKVTAPYPTATNEDGCVRAIAASDELGKKLRSLEMPLAITGVQGITDVFSFTDVFPPISTNYRSGSLVTPPLENNIVLNEKKRGIVPRYVKPIECVLQLEHSSKWPKNLTAIRHMKTAFYLEIAKQLDKKHKIVASVKPEFLDVLYEGYVFRYRLYLPREVGLLKRESTNNGVTTYKDTPMSRDIELQLGILPRVTGALKGIQSQFPSFGPSTALIKRWLRSQLIDDYHFPDHVINLLNASLFLKGASVTPQVGFLRFLKFVSELQCDIQAVVVNFNNEIASETLAEIDSKLLQNREALPDLFIAMPYDGCESVFTKRGPSKLVLRRVKQLASESLNCFGQIIKGESFGSIKSLFIPNLEGYDVIIHLRPLLNPVRHEQVTGDESEGQIVLEEFNRNESTKIPVTGFNPVQLYLAELRKHYGDFANFFHDTYGGNFIGVLWIPKALESRDFKVSYASGRKLVNGKLELNVDALIEDFYIVGKGLVKSIDKKK
ncbi:nucleolar protein 6 [Tribolium castaneum]|uniref:Nucleolar protein 6 n=1 Tax=Tribolium castaneum TaxID=7070 RepID=D6WRZ2_TRICA|nr:PREDICTED: nucleolar protein 6 [Tribolium castaneum]EFA06414.1 Nucleolar protein 6-like Protein [Tribolium castaneum]|eukprot:XP_968071.1 PREDICTED: nucleolar protein 6 [Tribolium castaneum]